MDTQSRIRGARFRRIAAITLVIWCATVTGCSTLVVRVDPSQPVALADDEGLLVLQIDTDLEIEKIALRGLVIDEPIVPGRHLWVARVQAGSYSWRSIRIGGDGRYPGNYRIRRRNYSRSEEIEFEIEPGVLNYVGDAIIRKGEVTFRGSWISVRVRNHAAMALRQIERDYPDLLGRIAIRTAETGNDSFFEYYATERARLELEASRSEGADVR